METVYDGRHPYEGKEFAAVMRAMSPRMVRNSLKSAYRKVAKKAKDVVVSKAASSGLRHGASVGRSVRVRIYPWGNGFMLTAKPRNGGKGSQGSVARGFHKNSIGQWKPIALWSNAGTQQRSIRTNKRVRVNFGKGKSGSWLTMGRGRGSMPAYSFMDKSNSEVLNVVGNDMFSEIEAAVNKRLEKEAIVTGE